MITEFFMPMIPPTVTHQEKKISGKGSKPVVYETAELKDARAKFMAHLGQHKPIVRYEGGIRLVVKWLFPIKGDHIDGEYKLTKPDTDNLIKLLKDCMTKCGYWKDDALVASEINEKFWAAHPGIYIKVESL